MKHSQTWEEAVNDNPDAFVSIRIRKDGAISLKSEGCAKVFTMANSSDDPSFLDACDIIRETIIQAMVEFGDLTDTATLPLATGEGIEAEIKYADEEFNPLECWE